MKILHLLAGKVNSGGAAKGLYCLHQGLKEIGIESKIMTDGQRSPGDGDITTIVKGNREKFGGLVRRQLESLPLYLYRRRERTLFSTGFCGYDFTKTELYRWADIIHLHWINAGFVNIKDLQRVDKPIVWTMRDMWPMTGGCHYTLNCNKYISGCGSCEMLNSKYKYDLSRLVLARKCKFLPRDLKLVGISNWLSNCARESMLFRYFDIRTIYNNVDAASFFPLDKKQSKEALGIRTKKKIILTGAQYLEVWKGFDKYLECLNELPRDRYYLLSFGHLREADIRKLGFEYMDLGYLHDTISLRLAYAAADVFVAPSIVEAFGKTLVEAMASGTPVVCFDATGPKEIVDHKENGYKAKPFESKDLASGIEWVVNNSEYLSLCKRARMKAETAYDKGVIAREYHCLYDEMIKAHTYNRRPRR